MKPVFFFEAVILAAVIAFIPIHPTDAQATEFEREDIIGQWRSVVTNPAHKNTVSKRYMRHTFFENGKVSIEDKKDSQKRKKWEYKNGVFIVSSSFESSKFIEHFKLVTFDELLKFKFRSIENGETLANYNPNEKFVRLGSVSERGMKKLDIFKTVSAVMDFVDPNTLKIGSKYTISKKTPIMPHYGLSNLDKVKYASKGQKFLISKRKIIKNNIWYQVRVGDHVGWIKSVALFGQTLKESP